MVCLGKFCKGCLPQILFGPFFNTLTHTNIITITFMLYNCISNNTFIHSKYLQLEKDETSLNFPVYLEKVNVKHKY